ncbi:class I SAM-dependent methyltransferase [Janthinobacterium sp. 17J80-10]|uniref:class I SAM-dependent methyltransferase n=1 Tax=Janthinobacterium sp. 17J80-10 TaxID=2497863 RepID=UPI0010059AC0|nr:class I SAM-dependent methyltransferase [Janthinobacterium sp. 17J80-10]QAU33428.1 class I SAM-dependent methyltransferase [Janthinobacterium sp. 17J80-10]
MEPSLLGTKYDKIAQWWHERHVNSSYGVTQFERALRFTSREGKALDVGCGAGGRFVRILQSHDFAVTGLDVSKEMIRLARMNHPEHTFLHQDICTWETDEKFNFILAWDSIFHLPFEMQQPVVSKLCSLLATGGILMYSFGDAHGEHTDHWHNDTFYYSSIGISENLQLLMRNGLKILHLELDQYPENHVYTIAAKP